MRCVRERLFIFFFTRPFIDHREKSTKDRWKRQKNIHAHLDINIETSYTRLLRILFRDVYSYGKSGTSVLMMIFPNLLIKTVVTISMVVSVTDVNYKILVMNTNRYSGTTGIPRTHAVNKSVRPLCFSF